MKDDLALTVHNAKHPRPALSVRLPVTLSTALIQAGYNRVTLTVTDDGILLRPYVSDNGTSGYRGIAEIPDWKSE